jgi:hypothetical protein
MTWVRFPSHAKIAHESLDDRRHPFECRHCNGAHMVSCAGNVVRYTTSLLSALFQPLS